MIYPIINSPPISRYKVGEKYSIPANKFNSYSVGVIIHEFPDDLVNYAEYSLESYVTQEFDWVSLADQIAGLGYVDYVVIRVKVERGFCYWPTEIEFNNGQTISYNGKTIPVYGENYHIGNPYYSGIGVSEYKTENAVSAFKAKGIKVFFYYPIGRDNNLRTILSDSELQNSANSAIYGRYEEWHNHVILQLTELVQNYDIDGVWLDNQTKHPWLNNDGNSVRWENYQNIYDTLKQKRRSLIIAGNLNVANDGASLYAGGKIQYFPADVIGQEYLSRVSDEEFVDEMTHIGSNYLIPKEYLFDGLYNNATASQYTWWDTNTPGAPVNVNSIRDQSFFQDQYNNAVSLGATPLINIGPIPASVGTNVHLIDTTYYSRLANIVL